MRVRGFDTLKLFALVLIIVYHANKDIFPGGFVGVDVFFLISGWVLTLQWLSKAHRNDQARYQAYTVAKNQLKAQGVAPTKERMRRTIRLTLPYNLRPSAYLAHRWKSRIGGMLACALLVVVLAALSMPDLSVRLAQQVFAALGFMTNFYEMLRGGSYEARFLPGWLTHTWFLALLEQLSVVWVIGLYAITKHALPTKTRPAEKSNLSVCDRLMLVRCQRVWRVGALASALSLFLLWSGVALGLDSSLLYYCPLTHAYPFMLGSALGALCLTNDVVTGATSQQAASNRAPSAPAPAPAEKILRSVVLFVLVCACVAAFVGLSLTVSFESSWTFTAALPATTLVAALMCVALYRLQKLGVSLGVAIPYADTAMYVVYLFHWPLMVACKFWLNSPWAPLMAIVATLVLAVPTVYILSQLQRPTTPRAAQMTRVLKPALGLAGVAACVALIGLSNGAPAMSYIERDLMQNSMAQDFDGAQAIKASIAGAQQGLDAVANADGSADASSNKSQLSSQFPEGVTVIGDSVTAGTRKQILAGIPNSNVNAEGNRQISGATEALDQLVAQKQLRQVVVLACGTNALDDYKEAFDTFVEHVPDGCRLIVMTPHDGNAKPHWNSELLADYEREVVPKIDYAVLADWNTLAKQNKALFAGSDGTHFSGIAALHDLYNKCILDALAQVEERPAKGESA